MSSPTDELKELRTIIVKHTSDMLDNPGECDIYPTGKFYDDLEADIKALIAASQNHLLDVVDDGVKDKQTYSDWDSESYKDGYNEANAAWHAHIAEVRGKL